MFYRRVESSGEWNSNTHNDYDYDCVMWYGDRSPARNRTGPWKWSGWKSIPLIHKEMNGSPVMLDNQRCPTCNPYTDEEEMLALGYDD